MNEKIKRELIKIVNIETDYYDGAYLVYSKNIIRIIIKSIYKVIRKYGNVKCLYSIKANLNNEIISFIAESIDGFDVASWNEYQKVKIDNTKYITTK